MAKTTENKKQDLPSNQEASRQILADEYRLLQDRFLSLRDEGINRLNFFITVTSVSLGSLLIFGASNMPLQYFKITLLIVLAVLALVNFDICKFLVSRDVVTDRYERGLARIRSYFVKLDPTVGDYFVTNITDKPTNYLIQKNSGMQRTAQILEGFLLGLFSAILATFSSLAIEIDFAIGCGVAIFVYLILEIRAQIKFNKALALVKKDIKERAIKEKAYLAITRAVQKGQLEEPFSQEDFQRICPDLGEETDKIFLKKYCKENPEGRSELFELVEKDKFRLLRPLRYGL
jgi:hypothetical protein